LHASFAVPSLGPFQRLPARSPPPLSCAQQSPLHSTLLFLAHMSRLPSSAFAPAGLQPAAFRCWWRCWRRAPYSRRSAHGPANRAGTPHRLHWKSIVATRSQL
jgi:hypothetical protein